MTLSDVFCGGETIVIRNNISFVSPEWSNAKAGNFVTVRMILLSSSLLRVNWQGFLPTKGANVSRIINRRAILRYNIILRGDDSTGITRRRTAEIFGGHARPSRTTHAVGGKCRGEMCALKRRTVVVHGRIPLETYSWRTIVT